MDMRSICFGKATSDELDAPIECSLVLTSEWGGDAFVEDSKAFTRAILKEAGSDPNNPANKVVDNPHLMLMNLIMYLSKNAKFIVDLYAERADQARVPVVVIDVVNGMELK